MEILSRDKFDIIERKIRELGEYASENQKAISRTLKDDGSILTETDLRISTCLIELIHKLFPGSNIISEEHPKPFREDAPYTFILDPIDGTDVYSQGLGSYAIALGILDSNRTPIAAIIDCPDFLFFGEKLHVSLFPGEEVKVNGNEFHLSGNKDEIHQIMMTSHELGCYDLKAFQAKGRSLGSTILHILLPTLMVDVQGALLQRCYAWDIAASHAILEKASMRIEYLEGGVLSYSDEMLRDRKKCLQPFLVGTARGIENLRRMIHRY